MNICLGIDADIITASVAATPAFVNVDATGSRSGLLESFVADALVGSHHVFTNSVGADFVVDGTLVYVLATPAVLGEL